MIRIPTPPPVVAHIIRVGDLVRHVSEWDGYAREVRSVVNFAGLLKYEIGYWDSLAHKESGRTYTWHTRSELRLLAKREDVKWPESYTT